MVISLIACAIRVLVEVLKGFTVWRPQGGPADARAAARAGCACGWARGVFSGPCRGAWPCIHPESHLQWPLSRIVALHPSGEPFAVVPVEDRGFASIRRAIRTGLWRGSWHWIHGPCRGTWHWIRPYRDPFRKPTGTRSANLPGTLPEANRAPVIFFFIKHIEFIRCP